MLENFRANVLKLLNEQSLFNFAVKAVFPDAKMIPFYVVTSAFHMISNG